MCTLHKQSTGRSVFSRSVCDTSPVEKGAHHPDGFINRDPVEHRGSASPSVLAMPTLANMRATLPPLAGAQWHVETPVLPFLNERARLNKSPGQATEQFPRLCDTYSAVAIERKTMLPFQDGGPAGHSVGTGKHVYTEHRFIMGSPVHSKQTGQWWRVPSPCSP
ncbi:hypothetical protein MTO96_010263 [Rhipicephalus appendiculatus]